MSNQKPIAEVVDEFDKLCEQGFADNRYTGKANYTRLRIFLATTLEAERKAAEEMVREMLASIKALETSDNAEFGSGYLNGTGDASFEVSTIAQKHGIDLNQPPHAKE